MAPTSRLQPVDGLDTSCLCLTVDSCTLRSRKVNEIRSGGTSLVLKASFSARTLGRGSELCAHSADSFVSTTISRC